MTDNEENEKPLTPEARDHALGKLDELLIHLIRHSAVKQNADQAKLCLRAFRQVRKELPVLETKAAYADAELALQELFRKGLEDGDTEVISANATLEMRRRELVTLLSFIKS